VYTRLRRDDAQAPATDGEPFQTDEGEMMPAIKEKRTFAGGYQGKHEQCPACQYRLDILFSSTPHEPVEVGAIISRRSSGVFFKKDEMGSKTADVMGLMFTCPRCGYWWTEKVPE